MTKAASTFAALVRTLLLCVLLAAAAPAMAQPDLLPSWNDGAAKRAIVGFVTETTTAGRPGFVPEGKMR
jgi:hypothetical protein